MLYICPVNSDEHFACDIRGAGRNSRWCKEQRDKPGASSYQQETPESSEVM